MKAILVLALLMTTGCATTMSRPSGAEPDTERKVKLCVVNTLSVLMGGSVANGLCEENKYTQGVDL